MLESCFAKDKARAARTRTYINCKIDILIRPFSTIRASVIGSTRGFFGPRLQIKLLTTIGALSNIDDRALERRDCYSPPPFRYMVQWNRPEAMKQGSAKRKEPFWKRALTLKIDRPLTRPFVPVTWRPLRRLAYEQLYKEARRSAKSKKAPPQRASLGYCKAEASPILLSLFYIFFESQYPKGGLSLYIWALIRLIRFDKYRSGEGKSRGLKWQVFFFSILWPFLWQVFQPWRRWTVYDPSTHIV